MTIIWSGLAPHPPIILPDIGMERCSEVETTILSMKKLSQDFVSRNCDLLIVLSPHTHRPNHGICSWRDPVLRGGFSPFGHPELQFQFQNDVSWIDSFTKHYPATNFLENTKLDHGALVPLAFFVEAGWSGQTVVLGLPWDEGEHHHIARAIVNTADERDRIGLLASGDMSHCLNRNAPAEYHPAGAKFDRAFVQQVEKGHFQKALSSTETLRTHACEDVIGSCDITWQATGFDNHEHHFHSYEGPFGVGYTVSRFHTSTNKE